MAMEPKVQTVQQEPWEPAVMMLMGLSLAGIVSVLLKSACAATASAREMPLAEPLAPHTQVHPAMHAAPKRSHAVMQPFADASLQGAKLYLQRLYMRTSEAAAFVESQASSAYLLSVYQRVAV